MTRKSPYKIVKYQHVTEKAAMLKQLKNSTSNPCIAKYKNPKYVFIVAKTATKREIAQAIEELYHEQNVTVVSVNTINIKPKKRRVRGRRGKKSGFKKAVITLSKDDNLENT